VRHLDVVEQEEAVVHSVVTELRTDITNVDVLQWQVCLEITDLDNKWMRAERLAVDDQLGHYYGMVGGTSERSNPPLGRCEMGRVDSESLVIRVPCSCCLQSSYVGAVAQLGLCVTTNVLVVLCGLKELLVLLCVALVSEGDQEHALVQTVGARLRHQLVGNALLLHLPAVLHFQLPHLLCTSQRGLEAVDAAGEVVLRLVEDLLGLEDLEDGMLLLQAGLGKEVI
jgi:hypothetical protein